MDEVNVLIEKLIAVCNKAEVSLVLSATDDEGENNTVLLGDSGAIVANSMVIDKMVRKTMKAKDCDCAGCTAARKLLGMDSKRTSKKRPEISIEAMGTEKAWMDVLERIFGGDQRDQNSDR